MTIKNVLAYFGGRTAASIALGVSYEAVRNWDEADCIPKLREFQIQVVSKNTFIAGEMKTD
jgi:hypothetical protein